VLVVSSEDGVQQQTLECIDLARENNVPMVDTHTHIHIHIRKETHTHTNRGGGYQHRLAHT
jgi:translation initiation factor IF-2